MRLALVSDIHGNLPALEAVISDLEARGITHVVNLGDHVSGPLWPRETADRLMQLAWPAIAGNHDRQVLGDPASLIPSDAYAREQLTGPQLEWLAGLPPTTTVASAGDVRLVHGTPATDLVYLLETADRGRLRLSSAAEIHERLGAANARLVACGHSHVPRLVTTPREITLINPGSVGLQAYDAHTPTPHVSETGSPHARYAIVEMSGATVDVTFVALEYDWMRAARRAAQNGRTDWAFSLESGYARREEG